MMSEKPIQILIADDHQVVASGIKTLLDSNDQLHVAGIVSNGHEVLEFLKKRQVDIALLDISMPVMDGLEATKRVHETHPNVKVLILSTHDDGSLINAVMQSGASGYILKTASPEELTEAILRVAAGEKVLSPHLTASLIDHMQRLAGDVPGMQVKVTRREKEIIRLIAKEYTTEQIAAELFISVNTVTTHKRNLFSKFDVKNSVGLVKKAMEMGIV